MTESNDIIRLGDTIPPMYKVTDEALHQRIRRGQKVTWRLESNTPCKLAQLKIIEEKGETRYEYMVLYRDVFGNIKDVWVDQETLLTREIVKVLRHGNAVCIDADAKRLNEYFSKSIKQASKNVRGVY